MRVEMAGKAPENDAKLKKACKDFEAMFLKIIWKEMQKSTGSSYGGYDVFVEEVMGDTWAKGGGLNLAKVIFDSVSNHPSTE